MTGGFKGFQGVRSVLHGVTRGDGVTSGDRGLQVCYKGVRRVDRG